MPQAEIDEGECGGLTSDENARLRELEAENAKLRMEVELCKRSVACWESRHSQHDWCGNVTARRRPLPRRSHAR